MKGAKTQKNISMCFLFVIINVSEKMWENSADLMLDVLPQKTTRNTVVGNAKKPWGLFTSTHQKRPICESCLGQYQQLKSQLRQRPRWKEVQIVLPIYEELVDQPRWYILLEKQVCWGREKPTLKQIVSTPSWLVVSTHLKNISQNGNLPQVGMKMKNIWNHHLARISSPFI